MRLSEGQELMADPQRLEGKGEREAQSERAEVNKCQGSQDGELWLFQSDENKRQGLHAGADRPKLRTASVEATLLTPQASAEGQYPSQTPGSSAKGFGRK